MALSLLPGPVTVAGAAGGGPPGWGPAAEGKAGAVRPGASAPVPLPHDLHIAYGDMAVEGSILAGRIRFFKDDLERALGPALGTDAVSLAPGPEADALVLGYVRERLRIVVDGRALEPRVLASGQDELDREPVWWITVEYRAGAHIRAFTVRNTLLFELFGDQRNVFKFVHFPDQTQRTFYFADGEDEHRVTF